MVLSLAASHLFSGVSCPASRVVVSSPDQIFSEPEFPWLHHTTTVHGKCYIQIPAFQRHSVTLKLASAAVVYFLNVRVLGCLHCFRLPARSPCLIDRFEVATSSWEVRVSMPATETKSTVVLLSQNTFVLLAEFSILSLTLLKYCCYWRLDWGVLIS